MKRVLFATVILLTLFACAPKPATEATPSTTTSADTAATPEPATSPAASSTVSMNYIDAAAALAADDMEKAKASLTAFAKESTGEVQKLAQAAADTGDIAAMRERFKALSAVVTTMELPDGYSVAFCPMYKGGSKWVQKKDSIHNPYYGKTMQTCGSFIN
jgi:hypothetical protein